MDWHRNQSLETGENGTYSAYGIGAAAVDFIQRRQDKGPWFMYLAFQSVHSPLEAPQYYQDLYPDLDGNQRMRNAMVTAMDDQMGNITAALKATGQMENTIIVFTSDNGTPYGLAYSMGDDKRMGDPLGFRAHNDRPPPAPSSGGGSNWPLTGEPGSAWGVAGGWHRASTGTRRAVSSRFRRIFFGARLEALRL